MPSPPRAASALAVPVPAVAAGPSRADAEDPRLERLLHDLGAQVHRGGPPLPPLGVERCATGLPEVDRLLGGGFPNGGLSELVGPASSGRTSLSLALLAHTTERGHFAACVDQADAFDPVSAEAAGVDLTRVLWARPTGTSESLRSLEQILTAQGFALVLWDLAAPMQSPSRPFVPSSAWPRLRKVAASAQAALVLVGSTRVAGTFADIALELAPCRARFESGPDWLAGIDTELTLTRNRLGPGDGALPLTWSTQPELSSAPGESRAQARWQGPSDTSTNPHPDTPSDAHPPDPPPLLRARA